MVSAVLSHDEITSHERCSQRRFGFSLITAIALHLALFVGFINFSFNTEPPELMMPAPQVIKASLVMSAVPKPKPMTKPQPVKKAATVQKAKPAQVQKQKPVAKKKVASVIPEPEPKPQAKPLPVPSSEPEPELEPVQTAVETQPPLAISAVAEPIEVVQPRQAAIAEESYVPPSSNVAYYHNPKPRYPMAAKRRGMEGVVELRVMVDSRGHPAMIEIKQSSGFKVLDREAIKAVWQWRFQAAKRGGLAVAGEVIVPVRYQLDSA